jgi:hypothetical protein
VEATLVPAPALINPALIEACAECGQDLEHCHGTAIMHLDGTADCTDDPGCRLAGDQHLFVISCSEAGCDCEVPLPGAGLSWEAGHGLSA